MTNTQAELREKFSKQHKKWLIGTCDDAEAAQEWVMENLPSLLALLPPAPAVCEVTEALESLVRVIDAAGVNNLTNGVQLGQTSWFVKCTDAMSRARKALATLGEGGAWSGWHPMSEAPKDGSEFLGIYWNPDHGHGPDYSLLRWDDQVKAFVGYCDGERSIKSEGDRWTDYHTPFCTHWRPLPEPKPLGDAPTPPSEGGEVDPAEVEHEMHAMGVNPND